MPRGLEATSFHRGSFLSMGMGPARGSGSQQGGQHGADRNRGHSSMRLPILICKTLILAEEPGSQTHWEL